MIKYIKIINSHKPDIIRGYAGSLYALCLFAEENDIQIFSPPILIGQAETVTEKMRNKIEIGFGTKLFNFYGSREVASIAGECKYGNLHIFSFNNYVEILDKKNKQVKNGDTGRVIITNLHNYSMPFIRYEIGDMAILGPKKCKCGNPLSTLKKVTGRITDHFLKEDGTIIHGEFFTHLFYFKDWIKAFRIIQENYKKIRILVVPIGIIIEPKKRDIENKIRKIMGNINPQRIFCPKAI